jgi:hypothetical protein
MFYKILADLVVVIHFSWILFLFFGAVWGMRNKGVRILHLSGLAFAFLIQGFDWLCPLTYLEVWLRSKHSPFLTYTGSFIVYYVEEIVYLQLSRSLVFILTALLCGLNAWLYLKTLGVRFGTSKKK